MEWGKNELGIPASGEYYSLVRNKEVQSTAAVQSGCGEGRADDQWWSLSSWEPNKDDGRVGEMQLDSVVTWAAR